MQSAYLQTGQFFAGRLPRRLGPLPLVLGRARALLRGLDPRVPVCLGRLDPLLVHPPGLFQGGRALPSGPRHRGHGLVRALRGEAHLRPRRLVEGRRLLRLGRCARRRSFGRVDLGVLFV